MVLPPARPGIAEDVALDLATYVLAALEGAIVLSRSTKTVAPLKRTARYIHETLVAARAKPARKRTRAR